MSKHETPTGYTISQCGESRTVWKDSKVASKGFYDDESCLHSIWVMEGKKPDDFYVVCDGVVAKVDRGSL